MTRAWLTWDFENEPSLWLQPGDTVGRWRVLAWHRELGGGTTVELELENGWLPWQLYRLWRLRADHANVMR